MSSRAHVRDQRGMTLIESMIGLLIAAAVASAAFQFYQAQHELYLSQVDIADRQGNLRFAVDELTRQVRHAGYRVTTDPLVRVSSAHDTLEVYVGNDLNLAVDTLRYFIDRAHEVPSLVRQVNRSAPSALAEGIDTVHFVPIGKKPPKQMAVHLVSVVQEQFENSVLSTRRRLGETVNLRNQ